MTATPQLLFYQTQLSLKSAYEAITQDATSWQWARFVTLGLGLAGALALARHGLGRALKRLEGQPETTYAGTLIQGGAELLRANFGVVSLVIAVLLLVWIFRVPQPGKGIIVTIALVGLGTKIAIDLVTWLLISRLPGDRRDHVSHRRAVGILAVGGLLAAMTIVAHLSAVPQKVINIFDWLCMLYLLLVNAPVLRARRSYIERLAPHYGGRYWFLSLRVFSLSLPIALAAAALVGLAGYVNLGWTIAWSLGVFLMVSAGWWVLRGLLNDLVVALKNYAVSRSAYGLLWTQEIIKPLHLLARVLLFLVAVGVLLLIYGLTAPLERALTIWQPVLLAVGVALLVCVALYSAASYYVAHAGSAPGGALIRYWY